MFVSTFGRVGLFCLVLALLGSSAFAQSGIITTYVGPPLPVNGAPAVTQAIDGPLGLGVAADGAGGFYVASSSQNRVYRVTANGVLTIVAGTSSYGFSGDGGPAIAAQLSYPKGLAVDNNGNLYIVDYDFYTDNARVRKVTPSGLISTVAGGGSGGDGPAIAAKLSYSEGLAVDTTGNLYIAEQSGNRIRKVTPAGIISTVAGNGTIGFSGDGGPAISASLWAPIGVAVDGAGNVYIVDFGNNRVRKVNAAGTISTIVGTGTAGFTGDGGQATAAQLDAPSGIAVDAAGSLYIAQKNEPSVRKVTVDGLISTVAGVGFSVGGVSSGGDGGPATGAQLNDPSGVAVDAVGNIYITEESLVRKVNAAGIISTVAGNGTYGFTGDGGPAISAKLSSPEGIRLDAAGNLYIADSMNLRVRKVTPAGIISTVAGSGTSTFPGGTGDGGPAVSASLDGPAGIAVDSAGNLYIADIRSIRKVTSAGVISTIAGNETLGVGFSGDGELATSALLNNPQGMAVDALGNVFIADTGNNRIRRVTPAGIISTVAGNGTAGFSGDGGPATSASLFDPEDVAVDGAGNLFIADMANDAIRKVTPSGIISTFAGMPAEAGCCTDFGDGGPATLGFLYAPVGIALDTAGNLYIGTVGGMKVRKVNSAGIISTVAGNGTGGFNGDGAPATSASLLHPYSLATDAASNLYISDQGNNRVRKVVASTSTPPSLPRIGSFAQVASGAGWTTNMTLTNLSALTVTAQINFYGNDGSPLTLPLSFPNSSIPNTSRSSANLTIAANQSIAIGTTSLSSSISVGWADVQASGPVEGYTVFSLSPAGGQGTVALDTRLSASLVLPYDNTNGSQTGIALANQSASPATITAVLLDQSGIQLASSPIVLPAYGHSSFFVNNQFSQAANRTGLIEFRNPSGAVTGVGLLFNSLGSFTSLPIIQ